MTRYYKLLRPSGETLQYRSGWTIPTDGPGPWVEAHDPGPLVPCENGVHVLTVEQLRWWARTDTVLVEVEIAGDEMLNALDQTIVRRARPHRVVPGWTDAVISRWARECAERALCIHAAAALRSAGMAEQADQLGSLSPIAAAATYAQAAAAEAVRHGGPAVLAYTAAAEAQLAVTYAAFSAFSAVACATYAADVAARAAGRDDAAEAVSVEVAWQSRRLAELVGLDPES